MHIRQVLPIGAIPQDLQQDSMSGIVGVAYHIAKYLNDEYDMSIIGQSRTRYGFSFKNDDGIDVRAIRSWPFAKIGPYDFSMLAPMKAALFGQSSVDINHVYQNPFFLGVGRSTHQILHFQIDVPDIPAAFARALHTAKHVICCSQYISDSIFARIPDYPTDQIHVIPNGVDLERFQPTVQQQARQLLSIPIDQTVLLYAGQVTPEKGVDLLIDACHQLEREDVHLVIAGSSKLWYNAHQSNIQQTPYEQDIQTKLEGLNVTLLGEVAYDMMPTVYNAADIFVIPSRWQEPFGMVITEAMACGLPVIGTRSGGIPEIIEEGKTGFLVGFSPDELASALNKLILDTNLRQKMKHNALQRSRQFSWEAIGKQVNEIYQQLYPA